MKALPQDIKELKRLKHPHDSQFRKANWAEWNFLLINGTVWEWG